MKKVIFAAAAAGLLSTGAFAAVKKMDNFNDVLSALKNHETVSVVIDYSKCHYKPGYEGKYHVGAYGLKLESFTLMGHEVNGKEQMAIGYARHNWYGRDQYYLNRVLIRLYQDNSFEVIDDEVDPTTYKTAYRSWLTCRLTANGSGGVTIAKE